MKMKFFFLLFLCIDLSIILGTSKRISRKKTRILEGKPGKLGQFPYQAAVWVNLQMIGLMRYSGGVFISNKHVLTSASILYDVNVEIAEDHHLVNSSEVSVVGGETTLDSLENVHKEEYNVKKIIVHEDYDFNGSWDNCIAILILDKGIPQNQFIRSVELVETLPALGSNCMVSGYGSTVPDFSDLHKLFFTNVTLIDTKDCLVRQRRQLSDIKSQDNFLCANEPKGGHDLCLEDEGGPLICSNHLAGIALSPYGYLRCHPSKLPGFYISVVSYANWIKKAANFNVTSDSSVYKFEYNLTFIIISIKLFCSLM